MSVFRAPPRKRTHLLVLTFRLTELGTLWICYLLMLTGPEYIITRPATCSYDTSFPRRLSRRLYRLQRRSPICTDVGGNQARST